MRSHMEYGCFSPAHMWWMFALGVPMILVWVIGAPLIAFIILFKKRHLLDDWKLKQYMLLLYQGLKPRAFYWEFINISRKFMILCCITFLSQASAIYQIMLSSVVMMICWRIQKKLKPYKEHENNIIELWAVESSTVTLFCIILFVRESVPFGFSVLATSIMFLFNAIFILKWVHLFMLSWNIKNDKFKKFLAFYSVVL